MSSKLSSPPSCAPREGGRLEPRMGEATAVDSSREAAEKVARIRGESVGLEASPLVPISESYRSQEGSSTGL